MEQKKTFSMKLDPLPNDVEQRLKQFVEGKIGKKVKKVSMELHIRGFIVDETK